VVDTFLSANSATFLTLLTLSSGLPFGPEVYGRPFLILFIASNDKP